MNHLGWFAWEGPDVERGTVVVARSPRGMELGEVLGLRRAVPPTGRILRPATGDDLRRREEIEAERGSWLERCERALAAARWSGLVLDVELTLDRSRLVVLCSGEADEGLASELGLRLGMDVRFEAAEVGGARRGGCGSGGCGECGTVGKGCGSGCGGCAVRS
jgi:hypothetical protein